MLRCVRCTATRMRPRPSSSRVMPSGPILERSRCRLLSSLKGTTSPKRRGSQKRNSRWPSSSSTRTWVCFSGVDFAGSTVTRPVMPRRIHSPPAPACSHNNLPWRPTSSTTAPSKNASCFAVIFVRSASRETRALPSRAPTTRGSKVRRMVSTSGPSGMTPLYDPTSSLRSGDQPTLRLTTESTTRACRIAATIVQAWKNSW